MERAIKKHAAGDSYQFWREFSAEEKFLLKGLELEQQGMFKISAFQDLGRAYGLADYESLMGPVRTNDSRTILPEELPRPDATRFVDIDPAERALWGYSPTRHLYHSLKLLAEGADMDRAVKHLVDSTDFWNIRTGRLAVILAYLLEVTAFNRPLERVPGPSRITCHRRRKLESVTRCCIATVPDGEASIMSFYKSA